MTDPVSGATGWILMTVVGFAILAIVLAYGTSQWNSRRKMRARGTVERAEGPAPKNAVSGSDDRRAL